MYAAVHTAHPAAWCRDLTYLNRSALLIGADRRVLAIQVQKKYQSSRHLQIEYGPICNARKQLEQKLHIQLFS
jgi:hypothetical protein